MITNEEVKDRVEKGWLKVWMAFEVLGIKEEVTKKALEELIDKLDKDNRVKLYKKEFSTIQEIKNPIKDIEKGYSLMCETEFIAKSLDNLVQIVTEYGPSATELLEPKKFNIESREAQVILNTISGMMHQFAAAGLGGIVFIRGKNE